MGCNANARSSRRRCDCPYVHISSIAGFGASTRTPPYAAIKATLMQYTRTQALDLAAKNIRVNCVAPGSIYFKGGTRDDAEQNNKPLFDGILKIDPAWTLWHAGRSRRPHCISGV